MKTIKNRCDNTMTESQFWGFIRSWLRRLTFRWKPRQAAKNACRRDYTGSNKKQKYEYECNICKNWYKGDEIEMDHKIECGSLKSADDVAMFIERALVEKEGWQALCKECHKLKTKLRRSRN